MAQIFASNERLAHYIGLARHVFSLVATLGCLYLIFKGIQPIVDRDAPTLLAMAKVIKAIRIDTILSSLAAAFFGVGWALERKGKKRALIVKSKLQHELEDGDPYRSSSHNPL